MSEIKQLLSVFSKGFDPGLLDPHFIRSFDVAFLRQERLVPLAFKANTLHAGIFQPEPGALERLRAQFKCGISLHPLSSDCFEDFCDWLEPKAVSMAVIFDRLLEKAKALRASDIHLEPQADASILVRLRIDGLLHDTERLTSTQFDYRARLVSKIKVAADLDIAETRIPQDGRITKEISGEPVDLRVSTLPSLHGEKVVIRLLPHKNPFAEITDLGLEGAGLHLYRHWIQKPQGMILITGQTGSGKTSTLYTTLSQVVHSEKNIITIEDPIEYQLKGVTQVQVHPRVGLTFASGLRAILRQDPDIILLGEIRDFETAEIAYQAALTGHLVLSTLHTNDAPGAIIRLMDIGVEPYLIANATLGVVAQRLVRKVCLHCAEAYTPDKSLLHELGLNSEGEYTFYRALGCEQCFHTGYYGRVGIFEVMQIDEELSDLIVQKEQLSNIRSYLQSRKTQSLFDSALNKVQQGITTLEEIQRVVPQITQKAYSGSVFVFMLFLLTILSVLISSIFSITNQSVDLVELQRKSVQGQYISQSALQLGESEITTALSQTKLHFYDPANQEDPITDFDTLQPLLAHDRRIDLGEGYVASYAITTHVEQRNLQQRIDYPLESIRYAYQITSKTDGTPAQVLTDHFEIQTGFLPLSFFECYLPHGGPSSGHVPRGPTYSSRAFPAVSNGSDFPYFSQEQGERFTLPHTLWPSYKGQEPVNPIRPSVYLIPVQQNAAAIPVRASGTDLDRKQTPMISPWALLAYGDVDRMVLQAGPEGQQIEIDQLEKVSQDRSYRNVKLNKVLLKNAKLEYEQWDLTLNPQDEIIKQKLLGHHHLELSQSFAGLVLVQGSIRQLVSKQAANSVALSIVASRSIGIASSLKSVSPAVPLGIIANDAHIQFAPLTPPLLKSWREKPGNLEVEGALVASAYRKPEGQGTVLVHGSVASLQDPLPEWLQVTYNPHFYSLEIHPPFFPIVNPEKKAFLLTKLFRQSHWQEQRP
jgi:general secretion pathway protein E